MKLFDSLAIAIGSVAIIAAAAGPVSAATTEIGAVGEIRAGMLPDPVTGAGGDGFFTVQVAEASGTYAVPTGYGVITRWSHSTGGTPGSLTFKVYRPTGPAGQFRVVAADTRTVTERTVHNFDVQIPVRPGDRIGISTTTVEVAYHTGNAADRFGVFAFDEPDPLPGMTATLDGPPFQRYKLDVAATIESDPVREGGGGPPPPALPAPPAPRALPAFSGCPASSTSSIQGTGAANTINGTAAGDRVFAGGGDDSVDGRAGDDCLDLGTGTDRGQGGEGTDLILGGLGRDRIAGGAGRDRLRGGSSNDVVSGGSSADRLSGGRGGDRISGNSGNDSITGSSGSDSLVGGSGRDRLSGGSGNDRINARDGTRDRIACGSGRDRVVADRGDRVARDCERVR